jgi:coenzyme F420-reducing hydrogenase beta subunit
MTEDAEGFLVPHINEAVCTDCGLCAAHCPQNAKPAFHKVQKVLGARLKNDKVLSESASGGVFSGLAIKILNEYPGSAVFGCAFDEDLVARHICVTDITNIELLQSSKYVQSDINDTYLQVETLLKSGKAVFLSGTPCQIAGLYAYIRRDYDNLYTADLFCHGVPSPLLFKRYLERLGKLYGEKITFYDFRNKDKSGWGFRWRWRLGYGLQIKVQTKTKTKYRMIRVSKRNKTLDNNMATW